MQGDNMEQRLQNVLDQAIVAVADQEYRRLSIPLTPGKTADRINNALGSLMGLASPEHKPPDYSDEWVALFYLTWYQPRQVNLALSLLTDVSRGTPFPTRAVDLCCGALAFQLALAVYAALNGRSEQMLLVHGIDLNGPMRCIGWRLWHEVSRIATKKGLLDLDHLMIKMSEKCTSRKLLEGYVAGRANWLTAIHPGHDQSGFKREMGAAVRKVRPKVIVCTTEFKKRDILWRPPAWYVGVGVDGPPTMRFRGWLPCTTRWRRELQTSLPERDNWPLLSTYVRWNPDHSNPTVKMWQAPG